MSGLVVEEQTLSVELATHGINKASPIASFWAFVADMMPDPKDKEACKLIGEEIASTHMAILVSSMFHLSFDDILACIVNHGGKRTWMRSIERLLNHSFTRVADGVPASAVMLYTGPESSGRITISAKPEKLGDFLKRTN